MHQPPASSEQVKASPSTQAAPCAVPWVALGSWVLVAMLYAVLRYHLVGGVPWSRLPIWTTNKAVSVAALGLLAHAGLAHRQGRFPAAKSMGLWGAGLAVLHVLMSATLWRDFPWVASLATNDVIRTAPSWLGFAVLLWMGERSLRGRRPWWHPQPSFWPWHVCVLLLTVAHVTSLGAAKWAKPSTWHALSVVPLPPLTMLSAVVAVLGLLAMRRRR